MSTDNTDVTYIEQMVSMEWCRYGKTTTHNNGGRCWWFRIDGPLYLLFSIIDLEDIAPPLVPLG